MEQVTVRIYRQSNFPMLYGAEYIRTNGQQYQIATSLVSASNSKFEANRIVTECEWEPFDPTRQDGIIEVGKGWMETEALATV